MLSKKELLNLKKENYEEYVEVQSEIRNSFPEENSELLWALVPVEDISITGEKNILYIVIQVLKIDLIKGVITWKDPLGFYGRGETSEFNILNPEAINLIPERES